MKATLNQLHHQAIDWERELNFYKDELKILNGRLAEVVSKNTQREVLAQAEHFQNKFIILSEQISVMQHELNLRNDNINKLVSESPEHIDERISVIRGGMLSQFKGLANSIADTRFEFNEYLSKVM
ncbi:MAG: hypothetical protein JWO03_818 [Bacteroidetes bacterium]|nr:hypothetical protein [Bacteroidota bacterium]